MANIFMKGVEVDSGLGKKSKLCYLSIRKLTLKWDGKSLKLYLRRRRKMLTQGTMHLNRTIQRKPRGEKLSLRWYFFKRFH